MPKITPGNHLYFYQLFSTEIGVGKQVPLSRIEEVLAEADVLLDDVECSSLGQLLGELSDFVKLTVFKKGRVFATVQPRPDLDELLQKAAQPNEKGAGGKSWKRGRRSKDATPTKPRHKRVQPVAEKAVQAVAKQATQAIADEAEAAELSVEKVAAADEA